MPESIFASGLGPGPANFSPLTPLRFLARSAAIYPERPAIIHGPRRISYREFDARARRLASAQHRLPAWRVLTSEMTRSERHTDIALAVLASASIAGIVWIARAG